MEFTGLDTITNHKTDDRKLFLLHDCVQQSNAIFAHSADIMKPMLPYLLQKDHASNSYWSLTVPTAAHSRVSICFHTFKVFHLTHSGIRLMQSVTCWIFIWQTAERLKTCHLHFRMRWGWSFLCPTSFHPWTNLARLFSSKYSDKIKICRFSQQCMNPCTSYLMRHASLFFAPQWSLKMIPKGHQCVLYLSDYKICLQEPWEKKNLCLKTQVLNHGFLVYFVVYHKLLKLVTDGLLMHFVNHKMKSNDGRGHKSVTVWCEGTVTASLYFKLHAPTKYVAAAGNITNTCKRNWNEKVNCSQLHIHTWYWNDMRKLVHSLSEHSTWSENKTWFKVIPAIHFVLHWYTALICLLYVGHPFQMDSLILQCWKVSRQTTHILTSTMWLSEMRFHSRGTHVMYKLLSHNPSKQATVLAAQD
jgi:hypothetical protein